ncbi:hypothetical protein BCR32DRAFT_285289 [Anaeromyces robustus]|uniref:Uncharacterized protein n=1 Tax=Anaeromyces robustus TaxID=1754192 RepID=A0A1Y1WP73_9FUNG|nr:hypothetical protein BCR32DRAFT_285289 [Anaeromyces robustus]|eukprot:ORX75323.1 hypothetical protein BCR32DRAFT_285289 [Anaeromyces robustus]
MTFDNALKVAAAVHSAQMASGSKRKRVSKGKESATANKKVKKNSEEGFRINKKKEFLLTYANTRGETTKSDVSLMIEEKQLNIEFIVSKEKNHNGEIAEFHIHSYLHYIDNPLNTRDVRYFNVPYPPSNQAFTTNHPNIRYKSEFSKNPIQATIDMIEYVTKEDQDPVCNFDWKKKVRRIEKPTF